VISIIIRTYNEEKYLEDLIQAINSQTYQEYEIILVDSGSNDNTLNIAEKYDVNIIKINKKDFSFGYSLNVGIQNSNGEYCAFISGHCIPDKYWLENLIKPFSNENVVLTYGKQIGVETSKFSEHQIFKRWFPDESIEKQDTPFCNNANSCIRKSFWENNHKFDETLTGLEDVDYGVKIIASGNYISYVAESEVKHIHDETYSQIKWRYERESITFYKININEHFYFNDFLKYFFLNFFNDLKQKYGFVNIISILKFRYSQFIGTYKGYKYISKRRSLKNKFYWK